MPLQAEIKIFTNFNIQTPLHVETSVSDHHNQNTNGVGEKAGSAIE